MKFGNFMNLPPNSEIVSDVFTGRVKIELVVIDKRFWIFKKKYTTYEYFIERIITFKPQVGSVDSFKDFYRCSRKDYIKYINNEKFLKLMDTQLDQRDESQRDEKMSSKQERPDSSH